MSWHLKQNYKINFIFRIMYSDSRPCVLLMIFYKTLQHYCTSLVNTATNPLLCNMTVTLLWKCNELIVTQQELLRYYSNASKDSTCHNIVLSDNQPRQVYT
jgi:endonuclease/exonuclease/phosphatase (EEP) superfamily protein YafD